MAQSPALARTISRSRKNDCKAVRSKPNCQGRIEIADAFPRRRLLEEIPREKMKVSSDARKMGREGVLHDDPGLESHETRCAEVPRANQVSRKSVDAIVNGAAPIKRHFRRYGGLGIERQAKRRAQVG